MRTCCILWRRRASISGWGGLAAGNQERSRRAGSAVGAEPIYGFLDNGRDGKRALTLSRYAGPGSHRYPVGFSGDTVVHVGNPFNSQPPLYRDGVQHRLLLVES